MSVFLVIAGCGGDSGVDTNSDAYQGGFDVCHNTPVDQHALELGVEAEPEAIADAIGFAVAGQRTGSDYEDAKQGCLDAYAEDS